MRSSAELLAAAVGLSMTVSIGECIGAVNTGTTANHSLALETSLSLALP
jgi:hypothetical protein